ncbi:hypothetical protein B0H13DRAFT_1896279 [Mycena leptocephala]|nr:hypothetical protein B0H13DRAFT_1896279 [Mycena leptocephala]
MPEIDACIVSEANILQERPVFYELGLTTNLGKCEPKVGQGIDRQHGNERCVTLGFVVGHQVSLTIKLPRWTRLKRFFGRTWVAFGGYKPKEEVPGKHKFQREDEY